MRLILDSNILISALIKDSKTREIILRSDFVFLHPKISIKNIEKYRDLIMRKSGLKKLEYEKVFEEIFMKISLFKTEVFLENLKHANEIIGHIDIEDVVFIALALSIRNDGIWSDDAHFQKQDKIKIYKTQDIIKLLKNKIKT